MHISALAGALTCAVGNALAGYFMKVLKLGTVGFSRFYVFGMIVLVALLITMANLGCNQPDVYGVSDTR